MGLIERQGIMILVIRDEAEQTRRLGRVVLECPEVIQSSGKTGTNNYAWDDQWSKCVRLMVLPLEWLWR